MQMWYGNPGNTMQRRSGIIAAPPTSSKLKVDAWDVPIATDDVDLCLEQAEIHAHRNVVVNVSKHAQSLGRTSCRNFL